MREPTNVEARFADDGTVTIARFMWRSRWRRVTGLGRQWREGEAAHFLTMSGNDEIFELVLEDGRWTAEPVAGPQAV